MVERKGLPGQKKAKKVYLHKATTARDAKETAIKMRIKRERQRGRERKKARQRNTGMEKWQ